MRVEMEDLLYTYGVDIVFNGHVSMFFIISYPYCLLCEPYDIYYLGKKKIELKGKDICDCVRTSTLVKKKKKHTKNTIENT